MSVKKPQDNQQC